VDPEITEDAAPGTPEDLEASLSRTDPDRWLSSRFAAGREARRALVAIYAFDNQLARAPRAASNPLVAEMRLAWWREAGWGAQRADLIALVDGWEALLADPPLPDFAVCNFAQGRAQAFSALAIRAALPQQREEASRAVFNWALADLAAHLSDPDELGQVRAIAGERDWRPARLEKRLRPLTVLHGLAARQKGAGPLLVGIRDGLAAMRLGLLGR